MAENTTTSSPYDTVAVPEPATTLVATPTPSTPATAPSSEKLTAVSSASLKAATLDDQEAIARLDNEQMGEKTKIDTMPVAHVIPEALEEEPAVEEKAVAETEVAQEQIKEDEAVEQQPVPEQKREAPADAATIESAAPAPPTSETTETTAVASETAPKSMPPQSEGGASSRTTAERIPSPPSISHESHNSIAKEIARDIAREAASVDGIGQEEEKKAVSEEDAVAGLASGAAVEAANEPATDGVAAVTATTRTGDEVSVEEKAVPAALATAAAPKSTEPASLQSLRIGELKDEEIPAPVPEAELVVEDRRPSAQSVSVEQPEEIVQDQGLDEGFEAPLPTDTEIEHIEQVDFDGDDDHMETDSTLGDDTTSLTDTINSQNYVYRYENGRRYHAFEEAAYLLPNDEREQERLDGQHTMWQMALGGKLHLAPISKGVQNVLDVATGTGIWALEMADEYPSARVFGTDLSPIQPIFVPPNCSFIVENSEDEWVWDHKFDFIHSRTLGSTWRDWPSYCNKAFNFLKPGGWVEFHEFTFPFKCDDGTASPTGPMMRWSQYFNEGAARGGVDMLRCAKLDDDLRDAGFTHITKLRLRLPFTGWSEDPEEKMYGQFYGKVFDWGVSVGLLTQRLGWKREEAELFLVDVRREAQDEGVHAYIPLYIYYAQKPESAMDEDAI